MKNNVNYIFRRVVVFFIIFMILSFFRSCEVKAATVGSYQFPKSLYQLIGSDTLNIPVNNAFNGFGYGHVTFTFASKDLASLDNNPIRSVSIYTTNGGGAFNCEVTSNTISSTGYVFYSANCPANVWAGFAISNIEIKLVNVSSSTAGPYNIYISNFMSFYGGENAEVVAAINAANIKEQILTIMQQLVTIDNRIATNFNTLIDYLNSKLDSQIQLQQQQIQKQQEQNDFLMDDSLPDNSSGDIGDLNNNIATNGTISSLITMPITFLQKIINGLNGACSPITIGELYEYNMTMPCINPQQYIGIIWNIIDVICAGFLSFHFGKKLVTIFHKVTSMKDGGLEEAYD